MQRSNVNRTTHVRGVDAGMSMDRVIRTVTQWIVSNGMTLYTEMTLFLFGGGYVHGDALFNGTRNARHFSREQTSEESGKNEAWVMYK